MEESESQREGVMAGDPGLRTSAEWPASIWAAFGHSTCQSSAARRPPWPGSWRRCPRTSASSRPGAARRAAQRGAPRSGGCCSTGRGRRSRSPPGAPRPAAAAALRTSQQRWTGVPYMLPDVPRAAPTSHSFPWARPWQLSCSLDSKAWPACSYPLSYEAHRSLI